MFVSGLTTFIQLYPLRLGSKYQVGARLPIVMGTSFTFVPTASAVGAAGGIGVPAHPEAVAQLPGFIRFIFNDAVTATCIVAIIANVLFPMKDAEDIEKAKEAMMG